jgi:hypothetical protein
VHLSSEHLRSSGGAAIPYSTRPTPA